MNIITYILLINLIISISLYLMIILSIKLSMKLRPFMLKKGWTNQEKIDKIDNYLKNYKLKYFVYVLIFYILLNLISILAYIYLIPLYVTP